MQRYEISELWYCLYDSLFIKIDCIYKSISCIYVNISCIYRYCEGVDIFFYCNNIFYLQKPDILFLLMGKVRLSEILW